MKLTIKRLAKSKRYKKRLHSLNTTLVVVTALVFSLSAYWQVSGLTHVKSTTPTTKVKLSVSKSAPKQVVLGPSPPVSTPPAVAPTPVPTAKSVPAKTSTASVAPGVAVGTTSEPVVTPSPSSSVSGLTPTSPDSSGTSPSSGSGSGSDTGAGSGTTPAPAPPTTTSYTSTNWSGYLEATGDYTSVSGGWVVPNVTGNGRSTSVDSAWVGIGGVTSSDLIQVGTTDTVTSHGQVTSSAFYEMLPDVSITIPGMTISAGDSISASVAESSTDVWTITITDNTSGASFSKVVDYTSTHSSVEWIEEDPSNVYGRLFPFANFDSINFFNASAVSNGSSVNLSSGYAQPITMVNQSDKPVATPSAIGGNETSFSVVYD